MALGRRLNNQYLLICWKPHQRDGSARSYRRASPTAMPQQAVRKHGKYCRFGCWESTNGSTVVMSPPCSLLGLLCGVSKSAKGAENSSSLTSRSPGRTQQQPPNGRADRSPHFYLTPERVARCRSTPEVAFDDSLGLMSTGSWKRGPPLGREPASVKLIWAALCDRKLAE